MLAHLYFFTWPFIVVVTAILYRADKPIAWWGVAFFMVAQSIWDLSWHSSQHHENLWTARPYVRWGTAIIVLVALVFATMP